jgi:ferric-dicitrate binding protein FerR (iron transport regulator)
MSTAQLSPPSLTPSDEQIAQIFGRLARRYPRERITLADLELLVRNAYGEFDTAAVRTFVAVLTERLVRHHIEEP